VSLFNILDFDVISDVISSYQELREDLPRIKAIKEVLASFEEELADEDDRPRVYVGLAYAILERGEKIPANLKENVLTALASDAFRERFLENPAIRNDFLAWCENFKFQVENDISLKKPVKAYKKYDFKKWKKGDLYCFTGEVSECPKLKAVYFYVHDIIVYDKKQLAPVVYAYVSKDIDFVKQDEWDSLIPLTFTAKWEMKGNIYRHLFLDNKFTQNPTYDLRYLGNYPQFVMPQNEYIPPDYLFYTLLYIDRIPDEICLNISSMKEAGAFPAD
jgi:hypothetical protein